MIQQTGDSDSTVQLWRVILTYRFKYHPELKLDKVRVHWVTSYEAQEEEEEEEEET